MARLATQIRMLHEASDDVRQGRPADALLLVEAWSHSGPRTAHAGAFARRLGAMYRAWAAKRGLSCTVLEETTPESGRRYRLLLALSGFAARETLAAEDGLHVLQLPREEGRGFRAAAVRVRTAEDGIDEPASGQRSALERARAALAAKPDVAPRVVRRYREEPSPLVRDMVQGWRTGRIKRVLDGDFDLFAARGRGA